MPKVIKADNFRYLTNDDWRTLIGVEMGMKNHELVPIELVHRISKVKRRGQHFEKILRDTLRPGGLVAYEQAGKSRCGYRLTNLGYDYLALHQLIKSEQIADLRNLIGTGKESDVYVALAGEKCGQECEEQKSRLTRVRSESSDCKDKPEANKAEDLPGYMDPIVIKFHRLGRTSFRKVKEKRDYHQYRSSVSWLYLDRLAAAREFAMMKALYENGLPVPRPLAWNRSAVVMEYLDKGVQLSRLTGDDLGNSAPRLYKESVEALVKMASLGLVHGDLNEFNLVIQFVTLNDTEIDTTEVNDETDSCDLVLRVIDFPQMVSRDHPTADELYRRDRKGLIDYFTKFYDIPIEEKPPKSISEIERIGYLDVRLHAPGYPKKDHHRKSRGWYDDLLEQFSTVQLGSSNFDDSSSDQEGDSSDDNSETVDVPKYSAHSKVDAMKSDDDEEEDEEEIDDDNDKVLSASYEDDSDSEEEVLSDEGAKSTSSSRKRDLKLRKGHGILSEDTIKERIKRERSKAKERTFNVRLKRQMRAGQKKEGRMNIKDSLKWC